MRLGWDGNAPMTGNGQLITDSFREQAIGFPAAVERLLSEIKSVKSAKTHLAKAATMQKYAQQLKAGVEIEKPIAVGVLKLKGKVGELSPPEKGGRGKKPVNQIDGFSRQTISAYRKIAAHAKRIDEYAASTDDVPSQAEFIRFATGTEKAGTHAHVSKNTGVPEWYTPPEYIKAARDVLGTIELDPATSKLAQKTVKAKRFYTIDDDGLSKAWAGAVWMNPPYTSDLVVKFTEKLRTHHASGDVPQAIVLVNNATETKWFQELAAVSTAACFPAGRIKFLDEDGKPGAPLQGQACIYLGSNGATFCSRFKEFGVCFERIHDVA